MKQGTLVYDHATDRYDIRFDLDCYYGGLHCGECFDVMIGGKWKPTRIEMAADWYLVGIRTDDLQGLRVRMWEDNKFFTSKKKKLTKKIAAELLDKGWCRVTGLYTPKRPQLYDAVIRLDDTGGKYISFKMEFDR